ncbi:hypothetical protein CB0940_05778 [Cercospora beticola]|uniref:Uncharacterized protein n=1 Tax=Cercospora beticola TaxID=122368 RepID=A0A2G5HXE8_CERBT|nr:hypothetical protein CB0940_05778 [Cercospora beticola]PIA97208.1 hypothetical protein CB0940_05778 [Cercospora beticola]
MLTRAEAGSIGLWATFLGSSITSDESTDNSTFPFVQGSSTSRNDQRVASTLDG